MRIGLVRRGFSATGGAEAYLSRLAREFVRLGHETVLFTTREWPAERWPGSEIVRLEASTPRDFAAAVTAARTGCDVMLSLERVPGCDVYRAGDGVHAAWLQRRRRFEPWWKSATRWINRKHAELVALERDIFNPSVTRYVIANSQLVCDEIREHFGFPAERIRVVPNGIEPSGSPVTDGRARAAAKTALGLDADRFCVVFAGSGWERKGLRTAISAVEMCPSVDLIVAGRGPADAYRSPAATFLGPVADVQKLFAAADIFVLPTRYDPFSNACLEALAAGVPVFTTPENGFSEIIEPGVHGEILPAGDAEAFAAAIASWTTGSRAAEARGACRARGGEFTIARNAEATLAVLQAARQA